MRICLDSNCLRSEDTVRQAVADATSAGGVVLIPDVLLGEMIRSSDWRSTIRSSLRHLRLHPGAVAAADGVGRAMRAERDSGHPCADLFDEELTARLRSFLAQFEADEKVALASIEGTVSSTKPDVESRLQSAIAVHAGTLDAIETWKQFLADDAKRRLRGGDLNVITEVLRHDALTDICRRVLVSNGFEEAVAGLLAESDSVCRRDFLAYEAAALRWLARGGLESRREDRIQNDYVDLDVLITGTYCSENRAQDRIIQELDRVLRPLFST